MQRTAIATSLTLALIVSSPALAAPTGGCGNERAGWVERSVSEAAGIFWAGLLDKSVFPGGVSSVEAAIDGLDRDDDDRVCMKIIGGDDLNPRSHWYKVGLELIGSPTETFIVLENNAAANGSD